MLFSLFRKVVKSLTGRGLHRLPLARRLVSFLYRWLAPKGIILIKVGEHKMYVDSRDVTISRILLTAGSWERGTTRLFEDIIQKGMVVLDVGANIGYFTLIAAKLVGEEGKVFAFEPEPYNFDLLARNLKLNGYHHVIPIQKAISDKNGRATLFLDKTQWGQHSLSRGNVTNFSGNSVEVEVQTLDDFLKDFGHRVDFAKIDVQGAESAVIQGMRQIIKNNKNLKLVVQFSPEQLRGFDSSPEELLNRLTGYGFKLYQIGESKEQMVPVDIASLIKRCQQWPGPNLLATRT